MTSTKVPAYAKQTAASALAPLDIQPREPGATDVELEILWCEVCHSNLHQALNEWHNTTFPCVRGHEIVGRATRAGANVSKFKPGTSSWCRCSRSTRRGTA